MLVPANLLVLITFETSSLASSVAYVVPLSALVVLTLIIVPLSALVVRYLIVVPLSALVARYLIGVVSRFSSVWALIGCLLGLLLRVVRRLLTIDFISNREIQVI